MKQYLSIIDAADYTGLSTRTLYQFRATRVIPVIKVGKSLRFDKADLDEYMRSHKVFCAEDEARLADGRRKDNRAAA